MTAHGIAHGLFQSTLPVWGATGVAAAKDREKIISIHAPRVGSDDFMADLVLTENISIHAPRVGSDCRSTAFETSSTDISIHAPRVGSDTISVPAAIYWTISIHAPRVGSDFRGYSSPRLRYNFNPRSPCGERLDINAR